VQPWWHPANLLVSHVVSSYLTLATLLLIGWAWSSGSRDGELLCLAVLAPVTLPFLFANYLGHIRSVFVHPNGLLIPLIVAALYFAIFAFRSVRAARRYTRHRRLIQGLCLACGYDLTANTSGTCPECGMPIPRDVG
jgi:hypothetical protein